MAKSGRKKIHFRYSKHGRDFDDPLYVQWRGLVRKRDGASCQMPNCSKPKFKVQVHHIKPWAQYPSLRYEVTNGICLCKTCHDMLKGQEWVYEPLFLQIVLNKYKGK